MYMYMYMMYFSTFQGRVCRQGEGKQARDWFRTVNSRGDRVNMTLVRSWRSQPVYIPQANAIAE